MVKIPSCWAFDLFLSHVMLAEPSGKGESGKELVIGGQLRKKSMECESKVKLEVFFNIFVCYNFSSGLCIDI